MSCGVYVRGASACVRVRACVREGVGRRVCLGVTREKNE